MLTKTALEMQRYSEGTRRTVMEIITRKSIETVYEVRFEGNKYIQHWRNGECFKIEKK